MKRTTDLSIINSEYPSVKSNWKDIYQWNRVKNKGNTEIISQLLLNDFNHIGWSDHGLRKSDFRIKEHEGYCQINTKITQFTEKRFCRALYNEYKNTPHPLIGKMLDYETPLTAPGQRGNKQTQGDIDLLSLRNNDLLLLEAKTASSTESILKAVLEIFVYAIRLQKFKALDQFRTDFSIPSHGKCIPCVLTFKTATSGKQILEINKYPMLKKLIERINKEFAKYHMQKLEFFVILEPDKDFTNVLTTQDHSTNPKQKKILFSKEVQLHQGQRT